MGGRASVRPKKSIRPSTLVCSGNRMRKVMTHESSQVSVKKRKKSAVVLPDGFVTTQTRSVAEVSVMVVDGMWLMLTDNSPDKCSQ